MNDLAPSAEERAAMARLERAGEESFARWSGKSTHLRPGFNPISGDTIAEPEDEWVPTTLDLAALALTAPIAKRFIVERLAPAGEVTLCTGAGAAGKSLFGQQLCTASAASLPCLHLDVAPGPAIYLSCEDDAEQLHWRQAHICEGLGVPMAGLAGRLHLLSLRGELGNDLCTFNSDGKIVPTLMFDQLTALALATKAALIVLDNVAHLFAENENDRGKVTRFVNLLNRLAGRTGAAIILIGHPNKSGDDYSGSTAWLNAVRSHFTIEYDPDTDIRTLKLGKANYAAKGNSIRFLWSNWCFVHEEDLPADTRAAMASCIKANGENAAFLACLRERAKHGLDRAVGPSPGPNYAPTQFERMAHAKGHKKEALAKAMERLFSIGSITTETVRNKAKGRDVTLIIETGETSPNAPPNPSRTLSPNPPEPAGTIPHAHTLHTTYVPGAALGSAAPDDDPDNFLDWADR